MNWHQLTSLEDLKTIGTISEEQPVLIFKHSTRCSISSTALDRMNRKGDLEGVKSYYLDLIAYRQLSQEIAAQYQVEHESPQVLLIKNGQCIYTASHFDIQFEAIKNALSIV